MSKYWFKRLISVLVGSVLMPVSAASPADNATQLFDNYVQWYQSCKASYPTTYAKHNVSDYVHYLEHRLNSK